jgi:hypothetical protein
MLLHQLRKLNNSSALLCVVCDGLPTINQLVAERRPPPVIQCRRETCWRCSSPSLGRGEARSALGPCRNGPTRALPVTNGRQRSRGTAGRRPSRLKQQGRCRGEIRVVVSNVRLGASGQQTGSNRPPWGPTRPLENRGRSSQASDTDTCAHLRLSNDPSRSLTIRRSRRARLVGSDTEEDGGSTPPAPTIPALSSGFVQPPCLVAAVCSAMVRPATVRPRQTASPAGCPPPGG